MQHRPLIVPSERMPLDFPDRPPAFAIPLHSGYAVVLIAANLH